MIIDDVDISIIKILYNLKPKEEIPTKYALCKKIFLNCDYSELSKRYSIIKNRLKKLSKYGIIKISNKNPVRIFELQMQNVNFKKFKFKDGYKKVICMKVEGKWVALSIENFSL